MARIRKIPYLGYGEHFIWADDETRKFMKTYDPDPNLQVLRCVDIEFDYNDHEGVHKIYFERLDGTSDDLFFRENHVVAIIDRPTMVFDSNVLCDQCGDTYGGHFVGTDSRISGIHCEKSNSGIWFVPNERSLRQHEEFPHQDFFESIGL